MSPGRGDATQDTTDVAAQEVLETMVGRCRLNRCTPT